MAESSDEKDAADLTRVMSLFEVNMIAAKNTRARRHYTASGGLKRLFHKNLLETAMN